MIPSDFLLQQKAKELETRELIKFSPIYFGYNSPEIRNQDIQALNSIVNTMLNVYPNMTIRMESYSDSRGPAAYNYKLSQERASITYKYLVDKGVTPARIIDYIGHGEEKLTNDCNSTSKCSEEQHQSNRRTQFIIVKMK